MGCYALKSAMNTDIAKQRFRTLEFRDRHGLEAVLEHSGKCRRTLYSWRGRWRERGLIGLAPESKGPRQRRRRDWPAEVIQRIRHYRELLPNSGQRASGGVAVALVQAEGAWLPRRRCRRTADWRRRGQHARLKAGFEPPKASPRPAAARACNAAPRAVGRNGSAKCVGLDAIKRRMGGLRRYILTCIDEVSDHAVAMAVPQLSSQAAKRFFEACLKLTPFNIQQVITDSGGEFKGEFDQLLKDSNIVHLWTYPKTPKMNAHARALDRAIQERFIDCHESLLFDDLALFNQKSGRLADQLQRHPTPQRACTENASSGCHRQQQKVQYGVDLYTWLKVKMHNDILIPCMDNYTMYERSARGKNRRYE